MAEWVRVAKVEECEGEGCLRAVSANGDDIVLVRWDGELFALEDRCSHQDYPLSEGEVQDGKLECIFHGAMFDLRSGDAVQLPAIKPVRTFPVEVRDHEVFVRVE